MDIENEANQKTAISKINPNYNIKKLNLSVQKNEHLKALIKLKQEEYVIERTINNYLENVKIDSKILKDLQQDYLNLSNQRQEIQKYLRNSVNDINECWNEIKNVINDNNFGNLDIDNYKAKLYKLWEKIQEFYRNDCTDSLKEEESSLDLTLSEFNSTLPRYENCDSANVLQTKNQYRKNSINIQDFEEVENFTDLVAKTGHTQNWSNEDHLLFLKLRKKNKTIPSLVYAIQTKCPDLTTKSIINHEAWYKFYLKLQGEQKTAIKDWRQQKKFQHTIQIEEKNEIHHISDKGNIKENTTKFKNLIDNQKSKSKASKELIKKWKEEKENERLMHEEQIKLEKQTKLVLENRQKLRAQRLKLAVEEYKKRKTSETKFEKNECKSEKIIKSPVLIKSFRKQDNYYIEKRKYPRSEDNFQELKSKTKTSTKISTLLKYTKVWKEKCKNIKNDQNQKSLYIKDLPKMSMGRRNFESL
ncbi:coiled-coil domain-containing protein 112-like [Leptopilina heterotoma]|uniref:coiled-coil domain-containing protein 112-like n=1 Tax=Leptopilina heterotoma TaxID=63436 RepID=UPI001CA7EC83|nr:coiled-coil domain-containing protein 112-like [Leptopilina heterotoma]